MGKPRELLKTYDGRKIDINKAGLGLTEVGIEQLMADRAGYHAGYIEGRSLDLGKLKELIIESNEGKHPQTEDMVHTLTVMRADRAGFKQGKEADMSNETLSDITITDIAINRSWIWMQEYDPHSGQVKAKDQPWANEARRAFVDGFLEGFEAKFLGEKV